MRNLLYLFFFITLLSSCDKGIDDTSKRNENWCWHVSSTTGKGEWIELGGDNAFPDGWYTMFYSNGNIFEKGKTEDGTTIDTMSSFDINGKISKYTYYLPDTSYEYYVNDGPLKHGIIKVSYQKKQQLKIIKSMTKYGMAHLPI